MNISLSPPIPQIQSSLKINPVQGDAQSIRDSGGLERNDRVNAQKIQTELSQQELTQLRELRTRDREVRAHEQAHAAVAGSLARGGPSYDYQKGPDGRLYAVGGEVSIDTSAISGDPQATIQKAQQIRRAALAPAQPSQQDRAVAAAATALEANARAELAQEEQESESDQSGSSEIETSNQVTQEQVAETPIRCAECGGQHSSHSHNSAIALNEVYTQQTADNSNQAGVIDLVT